MYVPINPRNDVRFLRQSVYHVLEQHYPQKLTASEICAILNLQVDLWSVTTRQVSYAIRYYALQSKYFAVFPVNGEVRYSIFINEEPYDAWRD